MSDLIIIEADPAESRRTKIHGFTTAGYAILDNRTAEQRAIAIERPWLSPEDRLAKERAEAYVRSFTHYNFWFYDRPGRSGWGTPWRI